MIRKIAGGVLVLHGLAHALPSIRVTDPTLWGFSGSGVFLWVATLAWALAAAAFVAAGLEARVQSKRYDKLYWRAQALNGTAVWSVALRYCLTDHRRKLERQPNCRTVLRTAVELVRESRVGMMTSPSRPPGS